MKTQSNKTELSSGGGRNCMKNTITRTTTTQLYAYIQVVLIKISVVQKDLHETCSVLTL